MPKLAACAVAVLLVLIAAGPAAATTLPAAFDAACPVYGDMQVCSGSVPSFDGSKLDVDLTLPLHDTGTGHPLIVMLHGFGNDKHEWESITDDGDGADKDQWNSHWFARPRLLRPDLHRPRLPRRRSERRPYEPPTPSDPSRVRRSAQRHGEIHIKSRDYEVRDTQWLACACRRDVPGRRPGPDRGDRRLLRRRRELTPGEPGALGVPALQDPTLPVLDLQVAIPKYPWTDVAYALAPNGHGGGPSRQGYFGTATWRSSTGSEGSSECGNVQVAWLAWSQLSMPP